MRVGRVSPSVRALANVGCAATGAAAAASSGYLLTIALAALLGPNRAPPSSRTNPRLVVLVPAHNESDLLGRCLESLLQQSYPRDRYRITVVADNCSDNTAEIAVSLGAEVLIRTDPLAPGKGRALRWAMDAILSGDSPPDAFVVIDADSVVDPAMLASLARHYVAGAEAVQAEYLALTEDESSLSQLRSAAFLLFHRVRFSGRAQLGLPCNLVGNGMLFSVGLVSRHPWDAFSGVEDLEYTVNLRLDAVRPVFAPEGKVLAPVASRGTGARTQRLRWEGARLYVVRSKLPTVLREILRHRRWELWDVAVELALPPLGVLAGVTVAGGAAGAVGYALGVIEPGPLMPWLAALAELPAYVLIGLLAADAPPATFRGLLRAPALVASEFETRLRLLGGTHADRWERTARPSDADTSS
jgi:hypothetical protein